MNASWLWVAFGGAGGAMLRYGISLWLGGSLLVAGDIGARFPWATLVVNFAGCFVIGWVWGSALTSSWFLDWGRPFLLVGVLGGFTTFSTFSLECLRLLDHERFGQALLYVGLTLVGCLCLVWLGRYLGQLLSHSG